MGITTLLFGGLFAGCVLGTLLFVVKVLWRKGCSDYM